jgi:hypothetical protein
MKRNSKAEAIIVGSVSEYAGLLLLLEDAMLRDRILGRVSIGEAEPDAIGVSGQLPELVSRYAIEEIIFCEGQLNVAEIIELVVQLSHLKLRPLFHLAGSHSIVGSEMRSGRGRNIDAFADVSPGLSLSTENETDSGCIHGLYPAAAYAFSPALSP